MKILVRVGVIAVLIFTILMNTSCMHKNMYPAQTSAMDSIVRVLHKTDSNLSKVDSVHIKKCIDHIFITLENVHAYNKDTMSKGATEILKTFNEVRWNLQAILGRQPILKYELKASEQQLGHLSHDVKNNLISKDSVMIFYNQEMKKATELIEAADHGMKSLDTQLPMYELIVPQADSLVSRLKTHKSI